MSTEHVADSIPAGYKQTEVGVIPEDWIVTTVGQIAEVKTGPFGSALHERDYVDDGTPIITVEHLGERGVLHTNLPMVSDADELRLNAYSLRSGDIVFSRVGSVDRNALIKATEDKWLFSGRLLRVRLKQRDIDSQYVSFHFHSETFKQRVRDVAVGQTMASINTQILMGVKMVLPPALTEQEAIATALSDTDALIDSLEQLIAKKRQIKQGAMQELLTGKRRLPGFGEGKEYKHTEVGVIPEDWECLAIGNSIDLLTGFPFSSIGYSKSGVRLLRGSNVKRGVTDWSEEGTEFWPAITSEIRKYVLKVGDIVIAMDGSLVGRSFAMLAGSDVPAVLLQRVARIRSESIEQNFLKAWICSLRFTEHCDSVKTVTAIPHISPADIKSFKIALPPSFEEQTAIASILSDMDSETTALEEKLAKTRHVKQGMMQELLTGRIRLV